MKPYNAKEFERRNRELGMLIDGKSHLYLEYCEKCLMPFIMAIRTQQKFRQCEDCRKWIKEDRKWQRKVKRFEKQLLARSVA